MTENFPSISGPFKLGEKLVEELKEIGLSDVIQYMNMLKNYILFHRFLSIFDIFYYLNDSAIFINSPLMIPLPFNI